MGKRYKTRRIKRTKKLKRTRRLRKKGGTSRAPQTASEEDRMLAEALAISIREASEAAQRDALSSSWVMVPGSAAGPSHTLPKTFSEEERMFNEAIRESAAVAGPAPEPESTTQPVIPHTLAETPSQERRMIEQAIQKSMGMETSGCQPVVAGPKPGGRPILGLMRHSIRFDNHRDSVTWNDERERPYDTPLNLDGIRRSEQRANEIRRFNFQKIVCSPFRRCLQTAFITASVLKIPLIEIDHNVGEIEGALRRTPGEPSYSCPGIKLLTKDEFKIEILTDENYLKFVSDDFNERITDRGNKRTEEKDLSKRQIENRDREVVDAATKHIKDSLLRNTLVITHGDVIKEIGETYGYTFLADYNDYFIIEETSRGEYRVTKSETAQVLDFIGSKRLRLKKKIKKSLRKTRKKIIKKARNSLKRLSKKKKKRKKILV